MATPTTTIPQPTMAGNRPPLPRQTASIKQEPLDPDTSSTATATAATAAAASYNQPAQQKALNSDPKQQSPPPFTPITEIRNLSAALTAFLGCFDDLQRRVNSLKAALDPVIATPTQRNTNITLLPPRNESPPPIQTQSTVPIDEITKTNSLEELEILCESMCGKGLRKLLIAELKHRDRLCEKLPRALKRAPNPASLVLECCGRFFLQGSKAYADKDSPMVSVREVSLLVLECFLVMRDGDNGVGIEKREKEEADQAAVLWKRRLVKEGGVARASVIDARCLLLWIGCFGVPDTFKNEDVRDLLSASNARENWRLLRRSSVLMAKVPEIIEGMINNKMEVAAVDIAYTFGLEDRYNPRLILASFLREFKESRQKAKKASHASPAALHEAKRKELAALVSVLECLEAHKIDPPKLLSGLQVREKISALSKDMSEYDKKRAEEKAQKRKADEAEPAEKLNLRQVKCSRYNGHANRGRHFTGSGISGHLDDYPTSPSILHAPAACTPPYTGVYRGMRIDSARHVINHLLYAWHGDPAKTEYIGHNFVGQPCSLYRASPSLEGYAMVPTPPSADISTRRAASGLYQFADDPLVPAHYNSNLY